MIQSQCTITDAVQVQHPKQGPLTLILLSKDAGAGDAWGSVYLIDEHGTITDSKGNLAGSADEEFAGWATYVIPPEELRESFRFMRPVTDRTGQVFMVGPAEDAGLISGTLAMDPDGYFEDGQTHRIDYDSVPDPTQQEYWSEEWGEIDENGFYTLRLFDGAEEFILHREGDTYVLR